MKLKIRGLVFVGFAAAVFAQSALATQTDANTVTSKTYVDNYAQAQAKRVTSTNILTIVPQNDPVEDVWEHDDMYPSMKVVSDKIGDAVGADAQPKANTLLDNGVLEQNAAWIGWHSSDNNENVDWVKLQGVGYTEIVHDANKGHFVQLDSNKIAATSSVIAGSGQGPLSTDEGDLTTAKAVYDFVTGTGTTGGFQPKTHVGNNETNSTLKVGRGEGEWSVIRAYNDQDQGVGVTPSVGYVTITENTSRGVYEINVNNSMVGYHGLNDPTNSITSDITASSNKLATGKAVYEYAVKQQWDATNDVGKHLVIDSNGVVPVSSVANPDIPVPTACATGTNVCALVAYWDATLNDNAGGVKYEWTVMAQGS